MGISPVTNLFEIIAQGLQLMTKVSAIDHAFTPLFSRTIKEVKIGNIGNEHGVNANKIPKPKNSKMLYASAIDFFICL